MIDPIINAAIALSSAVDAMWNDHDRVLSGRVREHHLVAITKAQTDLARELAEYDPPCTNCGGTGINFQTEKRCTCTLTDEECRAWQETREGMNR